MNELKLRISHFRSLLTQTLQAQLGKRNRYSQGIAAVTRAFLKDFDRIFSPSILEGEVPIRPLIDKHCFDAPNCPICGSRMSRRRGKFGMFMGCTKFPDCKGVRGKDGTPSINNALRFYLTQKEYEETLKVEEYEESRFSNLEI